MRHRLTRAILLLYPRRVRNGHGPEIAALIDDLIAHDGRSRTRLVTRLAVDGLVQRAASTATAWTVAAVMAATSFGGLAISDFAAADATRQVLPRTVHTISPARHTHQPPHRLPRRHCSSYRPAEATAPRLTSAQFSPRRCPFVRCGCWHRAADDDGPAPRGKRISASVRR
jgi:hypothetical protein